LEVINAGVLKLLRGGKGAGRIYQVIFGRITPGKKPQVHRLRKEKFVLSALIPCWLKNNPF
jgi:hypothetical protein